MSRDMNNARSLSTLPSLLRDARFLRQLSYRGAAEQLGTSAATLMRWENGKTSPTLEECERMAQWMGLVIVLQPAPPGHPTQEGAAA